MKGIVLFIAILVAIPLYSQDHDYAGATLQNAKRHIGERNFEEAQRCLDYIAKNCADFHLAHKDEIDSLYVICAPLLVQPESLRFENIGGKKTLTIQSHTSWKIVSQPKWIRCSKHEGIRVECLPNKGSQGRNGNVVIQTIDKKQKRFIYITQEASSPFLQTDEDTCILDSIVVIPVYSNVEWNAVTLARWFGIKKVGNDSLILTPYNNRQVQRHGNVCLQSKDGKLTHTIYVKQGSPVSEANITNLYHLTSRNTNTIKILCDVDCHNYNGDTLLLRFCGFRNAGKEYVTDDDTIVPIYNDDNIQKVWEYKIKNKVPDIHTIDVTLMNSSKDSILDTRFIHFINYRTDNVIRTLKNDSIRLIRKKRYTADTISLNLVDYRIEQNIQTEGTIGFNIETIWDISDYKQSFWNMSISGLGSSPYKKILTKKSQQVQKVCQFVPYRYKTDTINLDAEEILISISKDKDGWDKIYTLWMNPIMQYPQKPLDYNIFLERGKAYSSKSSSRYSECLRNLFFAAKYGNNIEAQYLLYCKYKDERYQSYKPKMDLFIDKPEQWLIKSADGGWNDAKLEFGKICYNDSNYLRSYQLLSSLDTLNDGVALYYLGKIYEVGIEGTMIQNPQLAFAYMSRADSCGNIDATYALGYYYKNGFGCEKDVKKSYSYFTEVEKRTSMISHRTFLGTPYHLGVAELYGIGCDKNLQKAISHLQDYSESFYKPSVQLELGKAYLQTRNDSGAVSLFISLAYNSDLESYANLVDKSVLEVFRLLGDCYLTGRDVYADTAFAVSLYQQGAAYNEASAFERLGECAQFGIGMKQDNSLADDYYSIAINYGSEQALYEYNWMHHKDSLLKLNKQTLFNQSLFAPEIYLYDGIDLEKNREFEEAYNTYMKGISEVESLEGDFSSSLGRIVRQSYCKVAAELYERIGDFYANGLGPIAANHHIAKRYYEKSLSYFESTYVLEKMNDL